MSHALTFDVEEFAEALRRTGYIDLGKFGRVPFTTEGYDEVRKAFLAANKKPRREPIKTVAVRPGSDLAAELGLHKAAAVEVYSSEDTTYGVAIASWTAELGRWIAARCLQVELQDGGKPLDEEQRREFYRHALTENQARQLEAIVRDACDLEVEDTADFSDATSGSGGDSDSPPQ